MPVLAAVDLLVQIGETPIVRGISLELHAGKTLGVVGESGCGKSMTGLSLMGMLPSGGKIAGGTITLGDRVISQFTESDWRKIRGQEIAMVMQDPFSSLNPVMRVGDQIAEVFVVHRGQSWSEARKSAVGMLEQVGVPEPAMSARKFPHQMSGGQRQRVVIAIAFACRPKVLIADEPTTALDVTLQAQVLGLIRELKEKAGTAVMLISHDIGVIAEMAHEVAVFYAGRIVETGPTPDLLRAPQHPYTRALLAAVPRVGADRLEAIPGQPPDLSDLPPGCAFAPRCTMRFEKCGQDPPLLETPDSLRAACWRVPAVPSAGPS